MRAQFPLFQSHLDLARSFWQKLLKKGDVIIDATCGAGKDSLALAEMVLPEGILYTIDIQIEALERAQQLLAETLTPEQFSKVFFLHQSHSNLPGDAHSVKGVVYNLGYLPKGNKSITTLTPDTLHSIHHAFDLICPGGFISITCYPGHPEGKKEERAIDALCRTLDPKKWNATSHQFVNRNEAPRLFFIQRYTQTN